MAGPATLQQRHCRRVVRAFGSRRVGARTSTVARASTVDKPHWTGDTMLSQVVNFVITAPALGGIVKSGARAVIKQTAEKSGVPWGDRVRELENTAEVYAIKKELENGDVEYPEYYLQPFHAYEKGNLNWLAAFEVEPASYVQALRTFKDQGLTAMEAMEKMRLSISDCMQDYRQKHALGEVRDLLDVGCSTGISTRYMGRLFPTASLTGLDLSPYMLAVAELNERRFWAEATAGGQAPPRQRIKHIHAQMEKSGLPAASYDLVAFNYLMHECPTHALRDLIAEARRLLRPGGMVMIADNNPQSKTIQNLPPFLFTLMKSTEPWSDQYYSFDMESGLREVGFKDVVTYATDHRHRAVMGHL